MSFKVREVFDGDSFRVAPKWQWKEKSGDGVRLADFNAPEKGETGWQAAKDRLTNLILEKSVELKNVRTIDVYGRLVCDVFIGGNNVVNLIAKPNLV